MGITCRRGQRLGVVGENMLHVGSGIIPRLWKTIRWNWDSGGRELKSEGDREEKYSEVKQ